MIEQLAAPLRAELEVPQTAAAPGPIARLAENLVEAAAANHAWLVQRFAGPGDRPGRSGPQPAGAGGMSAPAGGGPMSVETGPDAAAWQLLRDALETYRDDPVAAAEALRHWQDRADDPEADPELRRAARTVVRSCEGMLTELYRWG